jgi:ribonucleotide reductase alpha subunit
MQACAQHCVDGAISKTVHLAGETPLDATQVVDWIQQARKLECKGVAFYRRRSEDAATRIDLRAACLHSCGN